MLAVLLMTVGSLAAAKTSLVAQSVSNGPAASEVAVTPPSPPSAAELSGDPGDGLYQFIEHHGTVNYVNTGTTGNLARWRGGRQSICPLTVGLDPGYNAFVTARLRALATYVGAPVGPDLNCKTNVQILFTSNPQERLDDVVKWASVYFRTRYAGSMKRLIEYKGDHAIQGWYLTTRGGSVVLNSDVEFVGLDVLPIWPRVTQNYVGTGSLGTRLGGGSGSGIGIGIVILVVDTTKVAGSPIGTIADYLAMLTLSVTESPDHCDPLPSILDLMSAQCGARQKPAAITAGDLAFLKSLYYHNTGIGPSISRDEIQYSMLRQFENH